MRLRWDQWFGGLVNTVIGGAAGALAGATVNYQSGTPLDWKGIGTVVVVMSVWNLASYLKDHPLPIGQVDPKVLAEIGRRE